MDSPWLRQRARPSGSRRRAGESPAAPSRSGAPRQRRGPSLHRPMLSASAPPARRYARHPHPRRQRRAPRSACPRREQSGRPGLSCPCRVGPTERRRRQRPRRASWASEGGAGARLRPVGDLDRRPRQGSWGAFERRGARPRRTRARPCRRRTQNRTDPRGTA